MSPMGERRLRRRFGTRRMFESRGPGRYIVVTPLGMPLTRDGGRAPAIERHRADRTMSRPAGWRVVGPPVWEPTGAWATARDAAQQLHKAIVEHDRRAGGLAAP